MLVAVIHHSHRWWLGPFIGAFLVGGLVVIALYPLSKRNSVNLNVSVGDQERHSVSYFRNAFTGRVRIDIDGVQVQSRIEWIAWRLEKRYEIQVGHAEHHVVAFVKTRKKLAGGVRKQPVVAYADGDLVAS